jgi:hypothetical protein
MAFKFSGHVYQPGEIVIEEEGSVRAAEFRPALPFLGKFFLPDGNSLFAFQCKLSETPVIGRLLVYMVPDPNFVFSKKQIESALKDPKQRHGITLRELERAAQALETRAQPA